MHTHGCCGRDDRGRKKAKKSHVIVCAYTFFVHSLVYTAAAAVAVASYTLFSVRLLLFFFLAHGRALSDRYKGEREIYVRPFSSFAQCAKCATAPCAVNNTAERESRTRAQRSRVRRARPNRGPWRNRVKRNSRLHFFRRPTRR